jgi:hypothetical protein
MTPKVQNEYTAAWKSVLLNKLGIIINSADHFLAGLLASGTMYIFEVEDFSTGIRYIYKEKIRKNFPQF